VQHDTAIWRDAPGGTWYILSGGATYGNASNDNTTGAQEGNAQLWSSANLRNFSYIGPITRPGGPGNYWELPYLLPFDSDGMPLNNSNHAKATQYAMMFGESRRNAYCKEQLLLTVLMFSPLQNYSFYFTSRNIFLHFSYFLSVSLLFIVRRDWYI
jgi:hypothetical protein